MDLLGGDLSAQIKKEVFVECALGWWETRGSAEVDEVVKDIVGKEILGEVGFQNQLDRSGIGCSSLEDFDFLEEQKMELEERLRISGKLEEKWRRQYFAMAAQCELEEARFFGYYSYVHCYSNYSTRKLILFEGEWRV